MGLMDTEMTRALAGGAIKVTGFSGAVRPTELNNFVEGDTFTFPEEYEVLQMKFGDNAVDFILVEVVNEQIEEESVKRFFPSTMWKNRVVVDDQGKISGRAHTDGTLAEHFQTFGSVQDAMDDVKGKKVVISKMTTIKTLRYGTSEIVNATIPTIDLVEEGKKKRK